MSVFDRALERRFTESDELVTLNVTSNDVFLIRDQETGSVMRIKFSTLSSAISSAFSGSFASLVDGKVPAAQLPSFVDDVLEYATASAFPVAGEAGKIYLALDTNLTYRWSGSGYVEISASLALGETSSTAYRGDRGKIAYDHSQTTGNPHGTSKADLGLGNVDNTSDTTKFTSPIFTGGVATVRGTAGSKSVVEANTTNGTADEAQTELKSGLTYIRFFYRDSDKNFGIFHSTHGTRLRLNSTGDWECAADFRLITAGKGIRIKEGTNARMGVATLSGGTVTVSNNTVTPNTRIFLTIQSLGTVTSPKAVGITSRTAGTSFTISSEDATDTSVVAWELREPA